MLAGQAQLAAGAAALDVVVESVRLLEECPLFNAGRGAVYTAAGGHELDACVMNGSDLQAGAVAGLATTRNPVLAALTTRVVMDLLPRLGGEGGLIAVAANGNVCMPFSTEGMYRGVARVAGAVEVAIYGDGNGDAVVDASAVAQTSNHSLRT